MKADMAPRLDKHNLILWASEKRNTPKQQEGGLGQHTTWLKD